MQTISLHTDAYVLVKQWKTSDPIGLIVAVLAACVLTTLYECGRMYLTRWDRQFKVKQGGNRCHLLLLHLWRSLLHCVTASGSYVIMLFLMTYDLYVIMATLSGAGIGYFFFAHAFVDNMSGHPHKIEPSVLNKSLLLESYDGGPNRTPREPSECHSKTELQNLRLLV